jgi:glutathione-regulated potassium-efflux system ancillary protein KefF
MAAARISIIYAHPYPRRSRAGKALLAAASKLPEVSVRSLYEAYPDFAIDTEAEQAALLSADVVVWQSPFYWYGVPALMHLWFEKVLTHGWAYGPGADALAGKKLLWVTTTGTAGSAYRADGMHGHTFDAFTPHIEQTARFCGFVWEPPIVLHAVHDISDAELESHAETYRARLEALIAGGANG